MLNENIAKGSWTELKGHIQKQWGKLTDDEIEATKGDLGKLAGLVQQKYGEAQDSVREGLDSFLQKLNLKSEDSSAEVDREPLH